MITVIAEFRLPRPMTAAQARETFMSTAPKYQGMAGLLRKYYFLSQDGSKAGEIDPELAQDAGVVRPADDRHNVLGTRISRLHTGHNVVLVVARASDKIVRRSHSLFFQDSASRGVGLYDRRALQMVRQVIATFRRFIHQDDGIILVLQRAGQVKSSLATSRNHDTLLRNSFFLN